MSGQYRHMCGPGSISPDHPEHHLAFDYYFVQATRELLTTRQQFPSSLNEVIVEGQVVFRMIWRYRARTAHVAILPAHVRDMARLSFSVGRFRLVGVFL